MLPTTTATITYPACAIEEKASIRFTSFCRRAITLPTVIVRTANSHSKFSQFALSRGIPVNKMRTNTANPAALAAPERKPVTGVGAPV